MTSKTSPLYAHRRIDTMKATFQRLLTPANIKTTRARWGILILICLSIVALLAAPALMPEGYSWLTHTTSESAAQGLTGAWVARTGFVMLGFAVLWLVAAAFRISSRGASWMHLTFGVMMIGTAVYSHRPFIAGVPFDPIEDWLHSFTATLMGFAFSLGVFLRFIQRWKSAMQVLDVAALISAIGIPLLMMNYPGISGLVQRVMFLVAYLWYGTEAWQLGKPQIKAHSG